MAINRVTIMGNLTRDAELRKKGDATSVLTFGLAINEKKRHALSVLVTDIEFADSKGAGKDTVSAKGQSAEPETYDADIPF